MLLTLRALILVLVICVECLATPSISGVSGTLTNGSTITITGTNLYNTSGASKPSAQPVISSYDHSTSANNFHAGSIGGGWSRPQGSMSLTTGSPRTSLYQSDYKATYATNAGSYQTLGLDRAVVDAVNYTSFWHYRDYSSCNISMGGGDNNKLYRIYASGSGSYPTPYFGVRTFTAGECAATYIGGDNLLSHTYTAAYNPLSGYKNSGAGLLDFDISESWPLQQWVHFEILVEWGDTNVGNGIVTVWRNGQTIMRLTGVGLISTGSPNDSRLTRWGLVSGSRTTSGNEYLDQVYFDNSPARVFISTNNALNSTWPDIASTHHSEIQVPTTWTASSIAFPLNIGTFGASDTVYLYVVDSTGAISSPYTLALGGGGGDTTPPTISGVSGAGFSLH